MKIFQERHSKLEENFESIQQILEPKIYLFYYYLKANKLKGYAKWTVLSSTVKKFHPVEKSLLDIVRAKSQNKNLPTDEIYLGLKDHFNESFLQLN